MSAKIDVMNTWFERVWTKEDEATIDEMLVEKTMARGLGSQDHVGPEEFKGFHRAMLGLIGDVEFVIDKAMEDGDWLSCLVTVKGTQRKNGDPVKTTGQVLAKIVDGKIIDAYNHFDFMGLFEQCDLLP
jgi:hypothetical protein